MIRSVLQSGSRVARGTGFARHLARAFSSAQAEDLVITDRCVAQLKRVATQNECLRLAVEGGGCSGFEYKMSLDSEVKSDDKVFEKDGVKVVVDETSFEFVKGATVDFADELIRSAFRIVKNPIAEKGCSCGTSFAVKMD
uniref:Iron-sulfur cluster assembly 2 homolog, mitochondrial n=1 Tax=Steinernema glaseri TaxID=37863 RepID=A0A1I7Z332_9BILA